LRPERTEGGLRLFSEDDERRVHQMLENIAAGFSAAEAARLARLSEDSGGHERSEARERHRRAALRLQLGWAKPGRLASAEKLQPLQKHARKPLKINDHAMK